MLSPDEFRTRQLKYTHHEKAAASALEQCGVFDAKLTFISDTGNVIFRADTPEGSFSIRVYREQYRTIPEIHAEMYWLLDLRQKTGLNVPAPLQTASGHIVQEIAAPDADNKFHVVIFKWMPGEIIGETLDAKIAGRIGASMATLHNHAENFTLPADCFREDTDWQGMGHLFANSSATEISRIQSFLDKDQIALCDKAATRASEIIRKVDIQHNFGLIHSDLHEYNCLLHNGEIGIIDFEDCHIAPFTCDIAITICSFDGSPNPEELCTAFLQGYAEIRALPKNHAEELEAFMMERRLRLIRWVATWSHVDYFPFGRQIINNALFHSRKYIDES